MNTAAAAAATPTDTNKGTYIGGPIYMNNVWFEERYMGRDPHAANEI